LDNRPLRFDEWESLAPQMVFVSATPGNYEAEYAGQVVRQVVRPTGLLDPQIEVRPATTQVDDCLSEIRRCVKLNERVLVTVLTKKMAEDLAGYLTEHQVLARYLHSDVDTVERVEIIRDLRLGVFVVLVGINLLREGLDMPEVSLVAIFDADKEGFLRSERSLIQTMGRAARNLNGKAILYAEKITGSMSRAMSETESRRQVQEEFNRVNGITPKGLNKEVKDILAGAYTPGSRGSKKRKVAEPGGAYAVDAKSLSPKKLAKELSRLEEKMHQHARDLEFEEAAMTRDQITRLKQEAFLS